MSHCYICVEVSIIEEVGKIMELKPFLFYAFALFTVGSAVVVVTVRNVVHAAFSLMVTLFSIAGLYVFLQADFLAATQVIVYVGGILVLILFGVMMTSGKLDMKLTMERGQLFWGGLVSLLIFSLLLGVIRRTPWKTPEDLTPVEGTTRQIGEMILGKWEGGKLMGGEFLLPFEVASVILLIALIGAVLIARKEVREDE